MEEFIKMFFERHPYVPAENVTFKEKDGRVIAIMQNVGESTATKDEQGLIVGFDVLTTFDGEKVLFNKANYENIFHSIQNFGAPAKAPNINPVLSIPVPRGVIGLKKYGSYTAEVDKMGDVYSVHIYDDQDKLIFSKSLLKRDEVLNILKEYGLEPDEYILDFGGVLSTVENLIVLVNREYPIHFKVASAEKAYLYKIGEMYTPPIVNFEGNDVRFVDNTTKPYIVHGNKTICSEKIVILSEHDSPLIIPKPEEVSNVTEGNVYLFASSTLSTEPIAVLKSKCNCFEGVNSDGMLVRVTKLANDKTDFEVRISSPLQKEYKLFGDWKIYKVATSTMRHHEKVKEFTITKLGDGKYIITSGDKNMYVGFKKLVRTLSRFGVPYLSIQEIINRLENEKIITISLYKEIKRESQSDDTATISEQVKTKIQKIAQILGTAANDKHFVALNIAQQTLLKMLETETDNDLREQILQASVALDKLLKTLANRFYLQQNTVAEK